MTRSIDRRAARTRRALRAALIDLIRRKGYDRITVQDIIDEADVGRATFYAHYTGKDDLFRKGFERLREDLAAGSAGGHAAGRADQARKRPDRDHPLAFSLAMFEHASHFKEVTALLGERGGTIAFGEIRRILSEFVARELPSIRGGAVPRELLVEFIVSSFVTVLIWWLRRKPTLPPQQVDALFRQLVIHGVWPKGTV